MSLPIAVSPGTLGPGLYLKVDLLAGAGTPGQDPLKVLLLGPVVPEDSFRVGGDLDPAGFEVRSGAGPDSAAEAFGVGGAAHLAAKRLYAKAPNAPVDFMGYKASGTSFASKAITFSGSPSEDVTLDVEISGREFSVIWPAAMVDDDFALKVAAAITARTDDLPCVGKTALNVLTIEAKDYGSLGHDIRGYMKFREPQTAGAEAITGLTANEFSLSTGGTGAADFAPILAEVDAKEYAFILPICSNADVQDAPILDAVVEHISGHNSGLNAKLEQFIVASTIDIPTAKAASVDADSCGNAEFGELITCIDGRSLPGEFAAREAGGWLATLGIDPAVNRIGEIFDGVYGARDVNGNTPTEAQVEDALGNGVALLSYTAQGFVQLVRPVCTHSQDANGSPDRRLLDCQMVAATYIIARDLRSAIPAQFPQAKITPDIEPGAEPPPKNVIEERDVKAFVISRLRFWQREGVVTKASLDAAIADGSLSVKVNASDASQVDIVLPFKIVPPLAKFGVVVQRQPS